MRWHTRVHRQDEFERYITSISDADLLDALDLERPGLEKVRECALRDDFAGAMSAWREYFVSRTEPHYYYTVEDWHALRDYLMQRSAEECPEDVLQPGGQGTVSSLEAELAEGAESIVAKDKHGPRLLTVLLPAYLLTGDDKFIHAAQSLLAEWLKWAGSLPLESFSIGDPVPWLGEPWNGMNIRSHVRSGIVPLYLLCRESAAWDHAAILKDILRRGRWIYESQVRYTLLSNWGTNIVVALLELGLLFPEFREAQEWLALALDRIKWLGTMFQEDGWNEGGGYEMMNPRNFFQCSALLRRNGLDDVTRDWPVEPGMEDAFEYAMDASMPADAAHPSIGDGGYAHVAPPLALAALRYGRGDFRYMAELHDEHGAAFSTELHYAPGQHRRGFPQEIKPVAPDHTSVNYEQGGIAIMRSGWDRNALYMAVPYRQIHHGHWDRLSFVLAAYGCLLAPDASLLYGYADHAPSRRTRSHNTINVDGLDQDPLEQYIIENRSNRSRARCEMWYSDDRVDILKLVEPTAYERFSINMERTIVFVKPLYFAIYDVVRQPGDTHHDINWHLQTFDPLEGDPECGLRTTGSPGLALFSPDLASELISRSFVPVASQTAGPVQAPCIEFQRHSASDERFFTVLFPFEREAPQVKTQALGPGCYEVTADKWRDEFRFAEDRPLPANVGGQELVEPVLYTRLTECDQIIRVPEKAQGA